MTLDGFRVDRYSKALADEGPTGLLRTAAFGTSWGDRLRPLLKMSDVLPMMSYPNDPLRGPIEIAELFEKALVLRGPPATLPVRAALLDDFRSSLTASDKWEDDMYWMRFEHEEEVKMMAAIFEVVELVQMFERRRSHMCQTGNDPHNYWLERHWLHALCIGTINYAGEFFPVTAAEFFADCEKHRGDWARAASGQSERDILASFLYVTKELKFSAFRAAHPSLAFADSTAMSFIEAHSMDLFQREQSHMTVDAAKSVIKVHADKLRSAFAEDNGPLNKLLRLTDIFNTQFGRYKQLEGVHEAETFAALGTVAIFFANPPHLMSALHYFDTCVLFDGSPFLNHQGLTCGNVIKYVRDLLFGERSLRAFHELFPAPRNLEALLLGTSGTAAYRAQFIRRALGIEGAVSGSVYNVPDTTWRLRVVNAASLGREAVIPNAIIFTTETLGDRHLKDARKCFDDRRFKGGGICMILAVENAGAGRDLGGLCKVAANHWQVLRFLAERSK
jgi:hypothetical protein